MNKPFFSVIIPTFNRALALEHALKSVDEQTFRNFELIVVDDGSTDNTKDICEKFELNYIKTENRGVSAARNLAVKNSTGEWLCFLDSDDRWLPHKLQSQFDFIQENPKFPLVHGDEIWIRNGVRVNPMKKHAKAGGDQFIRSVDLCCISPSCVALKKELFIELGGFREDFPVCEDYDLWLKITSKFEVGYIDDFLIKKYGGHEDQLSKKYFAMDYWRVKSIDWILKNTILDIEKKEYVVKSLIIRAQRLVKGYIKHENLKNIDEIEEILRQYKKSS